MVTSKDQQLAHNLREVIGGLTRRLRKQVSNPEQLSVAEGRVVSILINQEEALPSELCTQLNISSQFMSQVLNRLEKLEYISRKTSRTDKRKSLVSLTKKGMGKVQQMRQQKEDWLASMISQQYSKQEKEQIAQAIHLLAQLYEDR